MVPGRPGHFSLPRALAGRVACRATCHRAPIGLRATKTAALTYLQQGERAAVEAIPSIEKAVFATEDFKEGVQSFIERRDARFRGR